MNIVYKTHIENQGWNIPVRNGEVSGTVGKSLRLEAIIISLEDLDGLDIAMEYQAHVQNIGWQPLKTDGEIAGTVGEGLRLEALRIRLTGNDAKKYSVKYQVHVENYGWTLWKKDGDTAGTTDVGLRAEAIRISLERVDDVVVVVPDDPTEDPTQIIVPIIDPDASIPPEKIMCASYATHIENLGWQSDVTDGRISGRVGQGLRMEAIRITIINQNGEDVEVAYQTHVENMGWQTAVSNGQTAGTTDQGLRLEAIKIWLTGSDADKYSIWYRVHVQNEAWQDWCRDGQTAGTEGQALRAEGIEIILTLKSDNILRPTQQAPLLTLNYRGHVQNIGWKPWVKNGQMCGTTGLGMRLEAIEMNLSSLDGVNLGVTYRVHVRNVGWQAWFSNGQTAGTVGEGLRIEAIEILLTGSDADQYTIQYRGHVENSGWTGWKTDGETLGTTGEALRLEAISVVVIKNVDLNADISNEVVNDAPIVQIWASDFPRADLLLHDNRTDYRLLSAKLVSGINKTDDFVFEIDPTHPHYNKLKKLKTTIYVYEIYSSTRTEKVFEGRILSDTESFDKLRKVTCEGTLAYLKDSIQRPATYVNVTPEQFLTMVLDNHNMQVTSDKRIHMGICTKLNGDGTGVVIKTKYRTYIENQGWLSYVQNGDISGTVGAGLRMEAFELAIENMGALDVAVTYRAYIENTGWQEWKTAGSTAGTIAQSLRMEAIEIKLTGADAGRFSIQYRSHVENVGWQDWCADGETSGTTEQALRIEALSIIIVSKVDGTNSTVKDGLFRENDYTNTYALIKTELVDKLGGVLVIEEVGSIKFLNYLENYGRVNEQPIKNGLNMLDYTKDIDASNIVTVIVPYGKEVNDKPITIASVNNNCDYIYDETAVAEYGWIGESYEWSNIDSPSALKYAAELLLAKAIKQTLSFTVSAIDLSLVNMDISEFKVGDMVRIISVPHNIDTFLSVSKKERDLFEHGNDKITLGSVPQTLVDRVSGELGGGITGLIQTNSNAIQNMEYVSNELAFMVKITSETVEETATTVNETILRMDAFEINLSAIQTTVSNIDGVVGDLDTRLQQAELSITPEAIVATVTDSTTYVTDMNSKADSDDLTNLESRVNTAEAKITPSAITLTVTSSSTYINDLGEKVNADKIINSINMSTEGITIQANKLTLSGLVTVTTYNGLVSGLANGTTTIDGDCITTGTLNANQIGSGTFNGDLIKFSSDVQIITGSKAPACSVYYSSTRNGSLTCNSSHGAIIRGYNDVYIYTQTGGGIVLDDNVTCLNTMSVNGALTTGGLAVATTPTSSTYKVSNFRWMTTSDYLEFTCTEGARGIDTWSSDKKLKKNIIETRVSGVDLVNSIDVIEFDWKKSGEKVTVGLLADDIELKLGSEHILYVEQPDGSTLKQLRPQTLIPLIIKAIQELSLKVDSVDELLNVLQKEVNNENFK